MLVCEGKKLKALDDGAEGFLERFLNYLSSLAPFLLVAPFLHSCEMLLLLIVSSFGTSP